MLMVVVSDVWLSIPKAVFLIATGDLQRACGFPEDDLDFLVFRVSFELTSKPHFAPLNPSFTDEQLRDALRVARQKLSDAFPETKVYDAGLKALWQILTDGLARGKGSRKLDGPFELIDPVEFTRVDLAKAHALHAITKKVVWYNVRVSARDLLEVRQRAQSGDMFHLCQPLAPDCKPDHPKRHGGWQHRKWLVAREAAMEWLTDNGCPESGDGGQAVLERHIASCLMEHGYEASESATRRHVVIWIKERREELGIQR